MRITNRWKIGEGTARHTWSRADAAYDPWWRRWYWLRLLHKRGPLSSVPPADHNPPTVHGCDDCSVEPGETHRYPECPGAQRARARLAAESTRFSGPR